jgi:hypothetical protein
MIKISTYSFSEIILEDKLMQQLEHIFPLYFNQDLCHFCLLSEFLYVDLNQNLIAFGTCFLGISFIDFISLLEWRRLVFLKSFKKLWNFHFSSAQKKNSIFIHHTHPISIQTTMKILPGKFSSLYYRKELQ